MSINRDVLNIKSAQDVVNEDLEYICCNLKDEFSSMAGNSLLITGGAGFLGYYLIQSVLHWNKTSNKTKSIRLTVYDNYTHGMPHWLGQIQKDKNLILFKHDITHPLPQDMGDFQYIIHAASIASPTYYRMYPIKTMDANIKGLRLLLEYCQIQKEKKKHFESFLFYSSSEIYGDPSPKYIPTPENYLGNVSCTGPRACYDESKRYGETLCVNFARQYHLPIKITRPFNNYGPGLKITDGRALSDFCRDVLKGRDIIMHSDGSPTRTFCYIADAIIGYYKVLIKGREADAYNIGTENPEISISELTERLTALARDLFNYKGKVVHQVSPDQDYLVDNPSRRCPMITKARVELGYNPSISLDEGLKRLLTWYYDNCEKEIP